MNLKIQVICAVSISVFSVSAAQSHGSQPMTDTATQQAAQQVDTLLKDKEQLEKAAAANPQAKQSLDQLKSVVGPNPADLAEAQQIAAAVFQKVIADSKGDNELMQQKMLELSQNPKLMENYMTPEMKAKMSALAARIEAAQNRLPAAK